MIDLLTKQIKLWVGKHGPLPRLFYVGQRFMQFYSKGNGKIGLRKKNIAEIYKAH
jgi:hypothetical protein